MGAQMVKQFTSQTSDEAGDGTTTATVAQAIVNEGAGCSGSMNLWIQREGSIRQSQQHWFCSKVKRSVCR